LLLLCPLSCTGRDASHPISHRQNYHLQGSSPIKKIGWPEDSRQISALKIEGLILVQGQRDIILPDISRLLRETGGDFLPDTPD
jgi:hypothetical protein